MTKIHERSMQEQLVLGMICGHFGVREEAVLESLPTMMQLRDVFQSVAQDLSAGDPYDQARAKDLVSVASAMDRDFKIYHQTLAALLTFRLNLTAEHSHPHARNDLLVSKSPDDWSYTRHYRMIEPRCSEYLGKSALGDAQPDQARDNEIAEKICARLPEACRAPLTLRSGPA